VLTTSDIAQELPIVTETIQLDLKEIRCLANNVYFEARSESSRGKMAIALVTMNRASSPDFPSKICQVVKQKHSHNRCQFSWWCDPQNQKHLKEKKYSNNPIDAAAYLDAYHLARKVYVTYPNIVDITKGAQFYHATYKNKRDLGIPLKSLRRTTKIGRHVFYSLDN
jgi:spore germination cell wall hydrolase CwlJ-like protein